MGCCGKAKDKIKNIVTGYVRYARGIKFEFTDGRIEICRGCEKNYWIKKGLWCSICKCFVPGKARVENEKCPLNKWKG